MQKRPPEQKKIARELVRHFESNLQTFENILKSLQDQIMTSPKLRPYIHSLKWRTKIDRQPRGQDFPKNGR